MAKTKQIGVRFTQELLDATGLTPQKALNEYEKSHALFMGKLANEKIASVIFTDSTVKSFDGERAETNNTDDFLFGNGGTNIVTGKPKKELSTLASTTPKNLQDLRGMCPKELLGMDRSNWMRENRVKYNL